MDNGACSLLKWIIQQKCIEWNTIIHGDSEKKRMSLYKDELTKMGIAKNFISLKHFKKAYC